MRFLLKIFIFLALLVISKVTREERGAVAQERPVAKTILTSYEKSNEEINVKPKEEEKKTKKIASSL